MSGGLGYIIPNQAITKKSDLKQLESLLQSKPVTLVGPKGVIQNVRVLGPLRKTVTSRGIFDRCSYIGYKTSYWCYLVI